MATDTMREQLEKLVERLESRGAHRSADELRAILAQSGDAGQLVIDGLPTVGTVEATLRYAGRQVFDAALKGANAQLCEQGAAASPAGTEQALAHARNIAADFEKLLQKWGPVEAWGAWSQPVAEAVEILAAARRGIDERHI